MPVGMVGYVGFESAVWAVLLSFFWRGGLCAHHQPWAGRYGGWREFGRVRACVQAVEGVWLCKCSSTTGFEALERSFGPLGAG
ncbi:hypothetical protein IWX49DRAFT_571429 [Phyllosticta citricarpa]